MFPGQQYMSSVEDYQISKEIADTSENIAEDTVLENGGKAEKSQLEAARAIEDEAKAFARLYRRSGVAGQPLCYHRFGCAAILYA